MIRGNAGEVMAVCGAAGTTRGVDSVASAEDAHDAAKALARERGCVVAVSGEADFVRPLFPPPPHTPPCQLRPCERTRLTCTLGGVAGP